MRKRLRNLKCLGMSLSLVLLLSGCGGLLQVPPAPQRLDLGAPESSVGSNASRATQTLVVPAISTSPILDGTGVLWRKTEDGMPHRYATYQWSAAPGAMVHERLVTGLSKDFMVLGENIGDAELTLRVNLLQFEQVYSADGLSSRAVVSVQAILHRGSRVLGQWRQTETQQSDANDAPGGARALRVATDRMVNNLATWVGQVASQRK